jgi:hypothetical protein
MNESLKQKIRQKAKTLQDWLKYTFLGTELVRVDDVVAVLDEVTKQIQEEIKGIKFLQKEHQYKDEMSNIPYSEFLRGKKRGLEILLAVLDGEKNSNKIDVVKEMHRIERRESLEEGRKTK